MELTENSIDPPQNNIHRRYYHTSRAYYGAQSLEAAEYTDEVMFGLYSDGGGGIAEAAVRFYQLPQSRRRFAARLEAFDEAWRMLAVMPELLSALAAIATREVTPRQVCEVLGACGFTDATPIEPPKT